MKKIPAIRFPEFSGEWVEKKLGDVGDIITGTTPSTKNPEYWNGDILFVTPLDIQNNKYISNTNRKITEKGLEKTRKALKGSVLFVCIGSTIGKIAMAVKNVGFNQQINAIFSKIESNEFLYYALLKRNKKIAKLAGEQAVPIINKTEFSKIKFHIPPTLAEQEKIANFLSAVDEKIEIITKKIEELKLYKKGLLQKMLNVTDKDEPEVRFKEFSGKWIENKLEEIGDTYSGLTNKNKEHFNKGNDYYIPFMNIMNNSIVNNFYLEKVVISSDENQNQVQKGDILFNTSSETPQEVGMCSVYLGDKKVYLNSFCFGFRLKNSNINSLFLTYLLRYKREIFYKIAQGATRYNLSKKYFNKIQFLIPPTLEEQEKIANFLSSIDEKIEIEENKLKAVKEYKKGLLQKMFV